jgi:ubiquitin-like protein Pup
MSRQMGKAPDRGPLSHPESLRLAASNGQRLKNGLDDLFDEVDRVLEKNAAAFRLAAEPPGRPQAERR